MPKGKPITQRGFTIIELMIATIIATIIITGISVMMGDTQRGWNAMYDTIYSDVVTDGYVARKTFDSVIRKASGEKFLLDEEATWLEVYYYQDANSTAVDGYTRFYFLDGGVGDNGEAEGQLNIEYGRLDPRETLSVETICGNVSNCVFKGAGRGAQMILTLDNGSQTATVVSSSVMHNE